MQRDVASHCGLPNTAHAIAGQQDKEGTVLRGDEETRTGTRNYFSAERNTRRNRKDEGGSRGDAERAEKGI